ncbi:50S ribosomal protein L4 [Odoribacter laneus]|jgi:50S ribosomal protein L4|uniref:Large ribosomal subunit protein uL4 n=1 Tax=Odoribacter laneus YIT 12061 TaxID=742817 RepID=H1DKA8_9BACT|nr:50S ribosomal protein L4 [Odoribacter laneus]MBS1446538.1 50S ribosomal protein L4 [Odoribacter sp.]EHP45722.1 50S ribosomal protein L4 [Odoribacter laneus YIT 12061]CCZ81780.1 50S ribosomal protein L4 [Odoribacter laneus CAG:561]GKI23215.1 50S ribosomal protein L4 [Odoribacter laneus]GKI25315.1 50S ribosomal protein L4 [Odoribacter laneus]
MELSVLNIAGKETGRKIELNDAIFGIEPNEHAIYLDVKQYLANQRQGTHKSKQRNEVSGSTVKLKKQKGTGGARAGSIKNPQFRGGGRVFGPVPRDYRFKLNKKLKRLARKSALAVKASANAVTVIEDFSFEAPKTKQFVELVNNLKVNQGNLLLVLSDVNENILLSARNLQNVEIKRVNDLATYNIMKAKNLVLVESSVKGLNEMFNLN